MCFMHGWCFFPPIHTTSAQGRVFCNCFFYSFNFCTVFRSLRQWGPIPWGRGPMGPLSSRLICSSSPGAHKIFRLFLFCQLGHAVCFVCWPRCVFLAEIQGLVWLASLRPACSLRCICSSTRAFVSVRTKPQQHQWQQRPASKPAAHQDYKSLQSSPFLFVFLTVVQLCCFAFYLFILLSFCFCTAGFYNLHKIPPSQCLLLVCACALLQLCLSVPYSVIKAPLWAQPRTAAFEWKGSPWAPLVLRRGDLSSVAM